MRRAVIPGLILALGWCAATTSGAQDADPSEAADTDPAAAAPEQLPQPQTAPAAAAKPEPGVQLRSEEELAARLVELRRRRSDLVAEYNRTYTLIEKSRVEAELRRVDALLQQTLGEQALRAQSVREQDSGQPAAPALGSGPREAEIVARLAELRRRRRELVDRYNTTYTLREKDALASQIERTEELIRNTEAELTLSQQASRANSP